MDSRTPRRIIDLRGDRLNELSKLDKLNTDSVYFFSTESIFKPLRSNIFEARTGFFKDIGDDYLRLDIGVSFDLVGLKTPESVYSFGADFFTFSNLRSESNFKFPVDAIDYFFGVNFNARKQLSKNTGISGRLRISHISSHLQDGHQYERTDTIFTPLTYSREFLNLAGIYDVRLSKELVMRNFLEAEFLFSSIPDDFGRFSAGQGIEFRYTPAKILTLYLSNGLRLTEVNGEYNLNENLEAGVRIGFAGTRGVNIFFTYYDGQDYKGQYYFRFTNYKAIGFDIDF